MKHSRRAFLEAGLAFPVVLTASPSLASAQSTESAASKDSSCPILAVIKNNGYGMGVTNVAELLEPQPEIFGFAVVKLHEAFSLRDAGIRKPVLLLGPFDEKNLEDAVARRIMPMIYTSLGSALDKITAK